jgi:hypothetical protein
MFAARTRRWHESCVKGPLARNIVKLCYQARAALPAKLGVALGRLTARPAPLEAGPLAALEREFGHARQLALSPLWLRGLDRVRLHAGLTGLAKLATALAAEVTVCRHVQQTNSGRMPPDAVRVTVSGLAPLV